MNSFSERPSFRDTELRCEMTFRELGPCWHIYTSEQFPIIFGSRDDFRFGMTLIAICAMANPDIKILTFEIMSNHLHVTVAGEKSAVLKFLDMVKKYLSRYLVASGRPLDVSQWECQLRAVRDLSDLRNVIVYNNRNGFLVSPDTTPFSYPWGANRFFFNPELRSYHESTKKSLIVRDIRRLFHTGNLDAFCGTPTVDGYISPVVYCGISVAEALFRNAHHYFHKVSRDIEGQKSIALEIGDRIFYTDDELFSFVWSKCKTEHNVNSPQMLSRDAKIDMAKLLHYDYNAANPQIARILRLDKSILDALFPPTR